MPIASFPYPTSGCDRVVNHGGTEVPLRHCYNVSDVRKAAAVSLPKPIFDYLDGGADDELTLSRNCSAFSNYEFLPSVLRVTRDIPVERHVMGRALTWPLVLSR